MPETFSSSGPSQTRSEQPGAPRPTMARSAEDMISHLSPAHTLDVACGSGFLTRHLSGRILGIDQSPSMIAIAQSRLPQGQAAVGDASVWNSPSARSIVAVSIPRSLRRRIQLRARALTWAQKDSSSCANHCRGNPRCAAERAWLRTSQVQLAPAQQVESFWSPHCDLTLGQSVMTSLGVYFGPAVHCLLWTRKRFTSQLGVHRQ